ncbi:MAG TPA: hypothetical protein VMI72_09345 [Roseiarcus sp.]|nr:hypothetical protein [Roseiarcus sp.]
MTTRNLDKPTVSPAAKRTKRRPEDLAQAVQERLDATPERLARAKDAGETPTRDAERLRRILDPFDMMRANRLLAPHDPKLNDIRWLIGESLRRAHHRARLDALRAVATDRIGSTGCGPRPGLPQSEAALHARDKLRKAADRAGPAAWPIVTRIVIEGAGVRECRGFVPELVTPWRADAVVADRLRVALDSIGDLMGITPTRR